MNKLVLSSLITGAAFAGFVGAQISESSPALFSAWAGEFSAWTGSTAQKTPAAPVDNDQISLNPVVIELFTSQGCSSCPPADMLAARLAKDDTLLVITRPVTYWDRLGWRDTLARPKNTQLQRAYAAKGRAGSGVYTPQIVVNGGSGAVGSREDEIRSLVRLAKNGANPTGSVKIDAVRDQDGALSVNIAGSSPHMAGISLLALSSSEMVPVARGENGGRTLHYTNVVKSEKKLGSWLGEPMRLTITDGHLNVDGADRYAILIQRPGNGVIIGAKMLEI